MLKRTKQDYVGKKPTLAFLIVGYTWNCYTLTTGQYSGKVLAPRPWGGGSNPGEV